MTKDGRTPGAGAARPFRIGQFVFLLLPALLLPALPAPGQAPQATDSLGRNTVACQEIQPWFQQHVLYLAYEKARAQKKDQAITSFPWETKPAPAGNAGFDPLAVLPQLCGTKPSCSDVMQFSLEKAILPQSCKLPDSAQLSEAIFRGSDLTGATFNSVQLENASFDSWKSPDPEVKLEIPTVLRNVKLLGGDLTGASFVNADMAGAVFEPDKLPAPNDIAQAENLHLMTYETDPSALSALRQRFRDGGFGLQDREITYALNERRADLAQVQCAVWRSGGHGDYRSCMAYAGDRAIDWTCQFGLNLWRPVQIGFWAWLVFAVIFFLFMHHPGPSGLYLAMAEGIVLDEGTIKDAPQVQSASLGAALRGGQLMQWLKSELRLFRIAMFFGLMNGFNIGFRDADIGRWLRLLPAREFEFRAVGWSRTFAGIQALLTLYLLSVWLLCFLGHPFD